MKLKLTTEDRLELSNDILTLLLENDINVKFIEVKPGQIHLETYEIEKSLERNIASRLIKIQGIKWVESFLSLPSSEQNTFYHSLINSIQEPLIAINNKGIIIYQNKASSQFFNVKNNNNLKCIFTQKSWANSVDAAATINTPVHVNTISGPMVLEVNSMHSDNSNSSGAVLKFYHLKNVNSQFIAFKNIDLAKFHDLIYENSVMKDVKNRAMHMSNSDIPIIIYGESGVGKMSLAYAMHHSSNRKYNLFSILDCSIVDTSNVEAKLFGSIDSESKKPGLLELSNGGTLYIKSIHYLSASCQLKLLDFIKNKYFYKVNDNQKNQANVKIIASSLLPLEKYVDNNQFNSELYYSLDIAHLKIPPLRNRMDEIELLANYFLKQFCLSNDKLINTLSIDALVKLKSYNWPGNLSQLKSLMFKAYTKTKLQIIEANDIDIDGLIQYKNIEEYSNLPEAVADFEKQFLQHWYKKHTSTRKLASHLGVSHTTIAQKLNKYGIS